MAYTPVSKKKTSGYVPVTKPKVTISQALDKQFPARELIRNSSYVPVTQKPKSRTEQNKEFETRTGQKAPFANTTAGLAVNTVLGLPKAAVDVAREIPRGFAGTAAQIVAPTLGIKQEDISLQPEGVMKTVLGDKPIQPAKEGADLLKLFGVNENTAKKYGPILYAGLTLSDFVSVPGKKKGFIEAAKMAADVKQANVVLKNAGISDDVIKTFKLPEKIVSAKTDADVELIFKNIPKEVVSKTTPLPKFRQPTERPVVDGMRPVAPTTRAVDNVTPKVPRVVDDISPELRPLAEEARKYKSAEEFVKAKSPFKGYSIADESGAKSLYHDTDPETAMRFVRASQDKRGLNVATDETFALGQSGRGAVVEFEPDVFTGKQIRKPGDEFVGKTEYRIEQGGMDPKTAVKSITFKDEATEAGAKYAGTPANKLLDQQGFAREVLEDGRVRYVNSNARTTQLTDIFNQATRQAPTTEQKLPVLPKLPEDVRVRLQSKQADETINQAIRDRYNKVASRPVKEDSALAKAAKKPGNIEGVKKITGELLTPISSRLMRINPILKKAIREFEFRVASNTTKDSNEILPLLQATKKMSKVDQAIFDLARKNGDSEVIDALATKYDLHDELNRTRDVLNDIFERAKAVGMDVQYRKDYFPRMVTNPEKFMAYLRGTEDWGIIQRLLDNAAKAKGLKVTDMTPEEQAALVNNLIRGYGDKITLAKPGFTKARTIDVIDDQLNEFYESSDSALSAYVVRMNDEIEGRKFFGKHSKEPIGDAKIEDSIGSYVLDLAAKGEIKPDQIDEVLSIFKARFHRGKMNGAIDVFRNAEYVSTMGSPISAITQIGDVAFSLFENGFYHTAKGIGKSAFSKNKLSKEALGIENITQEFTKNTMSGKALNTIFKLTGLETMDRLGKETLINGYLSKLKSQATAGDDVLKRELDFMFDSDEAALAMKELAEGKLTDRTKLLAFNKLLDYQPVAKSEMPQKYLEMPNGRIFYTLKSFTVKQYDVFRREAIDDIVSGDKTRIAKGMKNLLLLSGAFVAANATADEIKDLILGRETPMSDKIVDNLWRLVGATKYDVYKARADGIGQTVAKKILFPTSIADRFYKDITNLLEGKEYEKGPLKGDAYKLESTQTIPIGGKFYYWWFGRGAQKEDYKAGNSGNTEGLLSLPTLPELPKLPKLPQL